MGWTAQGLEHTQYQREQDDLGVINSWLLKINQVGTVVISLLKNMNSQ